MTEYIPTAMESRTILIVDDMPTNIAVVEDSLSARGFNIVVAQDGEEAMRRARLVHPELILLDIMMPGIDGIQVCKKLKADEDTRDIPVIFMTALAEIERKVEGFEAGGVDYITKPLDFNEVLARITTHLKLHELQRQLEAQNRELRHYREWLEDQVAQRTVELSSSNALLQREIEERKHIESVLRESEQKFRTLAENSPDMIIRYDLDCRRAFVNPAYYLKTGTPYGAAQNKRPDDLWKPSNISPDEFKARLRHVMDTGMPAEILLEFTLADGRICYESLLVVAERDSRGEIIGTLGIGHDVTELIRHEHLEEIRLRIFEFMARGGELNQILSLIVTYVEQASPSFLASIMLLDAEGKHLLSTHSPSLPKDYSEAIDNLPIGEGIGSCGTAAWRKDTVIVEDVRTHPYWSRYKHLATAAGLLSSWSEPIFDSTGKLLGTFGIYQRKTGYPSPEDMELVRRASHLASIAIEREQSEKTLFQQQQELRSLIENTPDTITRYNAECRRIFVNPKTTEDLGVSREAALNSTPSELPGGEAFEQFEQQIRRVFDTGNPDDFELAWRTGNGKQTVSYIRLTPEFGVDGQIVSVLAVGRDITEIDEYRQNIHHLAFYDVLTDLPNRALLVDRIKQSIADAAWHAGQFGFMMLDLDRFKEINDTLGHNIGDELLKEVASRLLQCVRSYDTVARLGGDEFSLLLPAMRDSDDLTNIAQKILGCFEPPFNIAGKEIFISCSIGIALYPLDSSDIDTLFRYADSAMYHAKQQGRNNFQFYSEELTVRSAERMALEIALRKARKNEEFELYFQPQIDIASGRIIGTEALLRWNQKDQGMIMPDRFIPVAEETGLIVGIGEWVLESACRAATKWNQDRKQGNVKVAVNLSSRQFIQNDLVGDIVRILEATQCKAEWLKLEITESLLLDDDQDILEKLTALHGLGLEISIDDFGTGYSSLSYLHRFPVSQLKIDRSFVRDIPTNEDKAELVKAMISIAQALHLTLVAEGVETQEQSNYLLANGCGVAQGYLYGRPIPATAFEELLQRQGI
ncbi:diguanylate cyclase [Novimethylophilus kurashikiensis]|uniref:Diguanylate cyclase n=1 Tax=Novimethylophilus kurashikiensis TaxID=1825523 RepID=A0A2R5FBT3_9PROT|nr:EAL domain-containing protein [Novimethylophilus kurashikiensis]GBG15485.1 diguanylate cyclase [Novimethylophilus kurashikiensis]